MSNSNRHPSPQSLQTQAYQHYSLHQYPQALQLYTEALKHPNLPKLTQLFLQTTISIIHIHLHNYAQAYKKLVELVPHVVGLRDSVGTGLRKGGVGQGRDQYLQAVLLNIKIEICLIIIELVNCNEQYMYEHLNALIGILDGLPGQNREILFRSALMMMFGVGSLYELADEAQLIANGSTAISPSSTTLLLSSLSLSLELLNNPQLSYQLQLQAYQAHKASHQTIPQLLSLKHLIHLSQLLHYQSNRQQFRTQFNKLMNTPEIYGISQQTLFRSYEEKIRCGRGLVELMLEYEGKCGKGGKYGGAGDVHLVWLRKKVVHRLESMLHSMENQSYSSNTYRQQHQPHKAQQGQVSKQTLIQTLNSLNSKTGLQIISYMTSTPLVESVLKQQQQLLWRLSKSVGRAGLAAAWRVMMMLPPRVLEEGDGDGEKEKERDMGGLGGSNGYRYRSNTNPLPNNSYNTNVNANKMVTTAINKQKIGKNYQQEYYRQQRYKKQYISTNSNTNMTPNTLTNPYIINNPNNTNKNPGIQSNRPPNFVPPSPTANRNIGGNYLPVNNQNRTAVIQDQYQYQQEQERRIQQQRENLRVKELELEALRQQEREKEIARLKEMQRKQQEEAFRERQARLREEERLLRQQRQKYEQFRTKQQEQREINANNYQARRQNEYRERQRDISAQDRDQSREDRRYISLQQQQQQVQKKSHRKMQYASVIQKSPIRINRSPSPYSHKSQQQPQQPIPKSSRIKIQRTQKSPSRNPSQQPIHQPRERPGFRVADLNNSKIANHMNNVYLDSESSRFVNPLEDMSLAIDGDASQDQGGASGNAGRGKIGVGSKIQKRNLLKDTNNMTKKEEDGVIGILRSQNSRMKETIKEIKKEVSTEANQYTANVMNKPQTQPQIQPQPPQQSHRPHQQPVINPNLNIIPEYETSPIRNAGQGNNIQSSRMRNLDPSHEQVQFNNVDIVIQPAVNPNNVSNFTNIIEQGGESVAQSRMGQGQGQGRAQGNQPSPFVLPSTIINNQPNHPINPYQNASSNPTTIRKIESSDFRNPRKLEPLTAKSPYIRKVMKCCTDGQYFVKRHYSSDGGEEKFVRLGDDIIKWAVDEDKIVNKYQSYKLKDIKGVAYGKVSDTFLKECNKKLLPWLCFSLIFQNRTLDFFCTDQIDPLIWLPGISAALSGQMLTLKYPKKKDKIKSRQRQARSEEVPISIYTPGRVLWKRFLMKLNENYIRPLKKNQRTYKNANAYSIILWSKDNKKSKLRSEKE